MRRKHLLLAMATGGGLALLLLFALRIGVSAAQVEAPTQRARLAEAVTWLVLTHQSEAGGFSAFSAGADVAPPDVNGTVDALLAIAMAGYSPAAPYPNRVDTPIDYLRRAPDEIDAYVRQGGGNAGKLLMALVAAEENPREFLGHNYVISLTNQLSPTGQLGATNAFNQSLAMLGLAAAGESIPTESVAWLISQQSREGEFAGSWDDGFGTPGNPDATAMAIMALVAAEGTPENEELRQARDFLASAQLPEGGWEYGAGFGANANSTALVIQALSALGEDFADPTGSWAVAGRTPLERLLDWQADNGPFQSDLGSGPVDDFFTTVQAIPALTGKPFPPRGRALATEQAVDCLASLQDPITGGWPAFAGGDPDAGGTARAIVALIAAGEDLTAERWRPIANGPLDALTALTPAFVADAGGGRIGQILQAAALTGADPADFAGLNLVISATNALSPTGEYDNTSFGPFAHNEAMLGLLALGEQPDPAAVAWLQENQDPEGTWVDADSTGSSLQVLALMGEPVDDVIRALRESQLSDGGWGFEGASSPSSTSEVVQGLVLAGENPFDPTWSVVVSGTMQSPAGVVLAGQGADGCWASAFAPGADPFSTTDAILLLVQDPVWGAPAAVDAGAGVAPEPTATAEALPTVTATAVADVQPAATAEPTATAVEATAVPEAEVAVAETAAEPVDDAIGPEGSDEGDQGENLSQSEQEEVHEMEGTVLSPVVAWIMLVLAGVAMAGLYFWMRRHGPY